MGRVGKVAVVAGEKTVVVHTLIVGPWGPFLFLALAVAALWATDRCMAALGFWPDEGEKGGGSSPTWVFLAALSTSVAVGAWYALAFVALPSGA